MKRKGIAIVSGVCVAALALSAPVTAFAFGGHGISSHHMGMGSSLCAVASEAADVASAQASTDRPCFADVDADGICDNCGVFIDANGDGVCDNFTSGAGCGVGSGFVDADGDGVCDNLGAGTSLGFGNGRGYGAGHGCGYVDQDGDGVCDNAGTGNGARGHHGGRH